LPVVIPGGVNQVAVSYSYDKPGVPPGVLGNAMDIGMFDQRGIQLGPTSGFCGWSSASVGPKPVDYYEKWLFALRRREPILLVAIYADRGWRSSLHRP
jgi:hypothetical protein